MIYEKRNFFIITISFTWFQKLNDRGLYLCLYQCLHLILKIVSIWPQNLPRRVWNGIKVLSSFYVSRILNKPIQWGYPVSISFEPTTSCNLRCPECPSGMRAFTRPTGMLEKDFFVKPLMIFIKNCSILFFYFQGEPYLNTGF